MAKKKRDYIRLKKFPVEFIYWGKIAKITGKERETEDLEGYVNLREYLEEKYPELEDLGTAGYKTTVNEVIEESIDLDEVLEFYKYNYHTKKKDIVVEVFSSLAPESKMDLLEEEDDDF